MYACPPAPVYIYECFFTVACITWISVCVQVVAAPVAAGLLLLDGVGGLRGWQWLFLLEGLPALLLGCAIRCADCA
jgi:MFS family permease